MVRFNRDVMSMCCKIHVLHMVDKDLTYGIPYFATYDI